MREITKRREPASLARHRKIDKTDYEGYTGHQELRESLAAEQRYICCYCMRRISPHDGTMKIEHWRSASGYKDLRLVYGNLLGACFGGSAKRQPPETQHCDARKSDKLLKYNPAKPEHRIERIIFYGPDGTISSSDAEFNTQLDDVLNLNLAFLKAQRKSVYDAVIDWSEIYRAQHHRSIPKDLLERRLRKILGNDGEALQPFAPVAAWWLQRRISRLK